MSPEVMTLFRQVADMPQADRADHYARQRVPDSVREEVESLLKFDSSRDWLLEPPSPQPGTGGVLRHRTAVPPERIGRFEVERLLGRGGMGEVYLARDPVIERPVAIKLIGSAATENETARRRLVREARTAGRLRHPNIVTIFEAGEHEQQPYIAMEFVPGETLRTLIGRREPLSLRRRLEMIEGACAGLAHAHKVGVVHLDIKPDNLMLDETGVVKVLDFGISRNTQADTLTAHVAGTLRYMSPEQIQGRALDHRSDTFSLGCALFELVTYEPAFTGSTSEIVTRIANGPVPRLTERLPGAPPALDTILARAMALDSAERYGDLEELRDELASVRSAIDPAHDPVAAPAARPEGHQRSATPVAPRSTATMSWRRTAVMTAAGVGTVIAIGAGLSLRGFLSPEPSAPAAVPAAVDTAPAAPAAATAITPRPAAQADDVWRLLARGERAAVIARLDASSDASLARAVVDTVRATVMRAREGAIAGAGTDTYRGADDQMARATLLTSEGRTAEALRALWQAGDLYSRTSPASTAAPAVAAPPQQTTTPPPPSPSALATVAPAAPSPVQDLASAPPPAVTPPPTTAATEKPAVSPVSPAPVPNDRQAVLETLRRYDAAHDARDVAALLRVFPAQPQVDQLRRTFDEMNSYEMDTKVARVDIAGDTATVQATVARRMEPRVGGGGRSVANELPYEFRLRRVAGEWVIVAFTQR
jgi:eukaryotic-like serine/threonine-protein kinase